MLKHDRVDRRSDPASEPDVYVLCLRTSFATIVLRM